MSNQYEIYEQEMKSFSFMSYPYLTADMYIEFFDHHAEYFTLNISSRNLNELAEKINEELLELARSPDVCTMISKIKNNEDLKESAKARVLFLLNKENNRNIFEIVLKEVCDQIIQVKLELLALIVTGKSQLSEIDGEYKVKSSHIHEL
jgi:hypothetical protein